MKVLPKLNILNQFKKTTSVVAQTGVCPTFKTMSGGCIIHSDMPVLYKEGKATLSTARDNAQSGAYWHQINTVIKNADGKPMGKYSYILDASKKEINYGYIRTSEAFRHKGIAEIMRLSGIMEIKENGLSALEILAVPSAIPFHSKYKFKSDVKDKYKALSVLDSIAKNTAVDKKYNRAANKYIKNLKKLGFVPILNPKCAKSVNKFIDKFIDANKDNWDKANNFMDGLPMVLTKEQIQKNSKFFNKLFKKHGIDYTV